MAEPYRLPPVLGSLVPLRELPSRGAARRFLCHRADDRGVHLTLTVRPADGVDQDALAAAWRAADGVVPLLGIASREGHVYEVTPAPRTSLADLRRVDGPFAPERLLPVVRRITPTLSALHRPAAVSGWRVLVHRGITADAVVLPDDGRLSGVLLDDLGGARLNSRRVERSVPPPAPPFPAPEMWTGRECSPEGDWFALGAMLAELLTGDVPAAVPGVAPGADGLPDPAWAPVPAAVPPRWRTLVAGLLHQDPAARWGGAQVGSWLAGEEPGPVRRRRPGGGGPPRWPVPEPPSLEFAGHGYRDPVALAAAMAGFRGRSGAFLAGAGREDLLRWARAVHPPTAAALDLLAEQLDPWATADRLIDGTLRALDPGGPWAEDDVEAAAGESSASAGPAARGTSADPDDTSRDDTDDGEPQEVRRTSGRARWRARRRARAGQVPQTRPARPVPSPTRPPAPGDAPAPRAAPKPTPAPGPRPGIMPSPPPEASRSPLPGTAAGPGPAPAPSGVPRPAAAPVPSRPGRPSEAPVPTASPTPGAAPRPSPPPSSSRKGRR